jgi:hypothetical protein
LEKALGPEQSENVAKSFQRTKKFVPTRWVLVHFGIHPDILTVCNRPHPNAPARPPYETFIGFLSAPIDKLKDYFSTFPSEEEQQEVRKNM